MPLFRPNFSNIHPKSLAQGPRFIPRSSAMHEMLPQCCYIGRTINQLPMMLLHHPRPRDEYLRCQACCLKHLHLASLAVTDCLCDVWLQTRHNILSSCRIESRPAVFCATGLGLQLRLRIKNLLKRLACP